MGGGKRDGVDGDGVEATAKGPLGTLGDGKRDVWPVSGASGGVRSMGREAGWHGVQGNQREQNKKRREEPTRRGRRVAGVDGREMEMGGDRVARRSLGETWCSQSKTNNRRRRRFQCAVTWADSGGCDIHRRAYFSGCHRAQTCPIRKELDLVSD